MAKMETDNSSLFPILQSASTGICRMAEESEQIDVGHDVEFRSLGVRSVLNKSVSKRFHWITWSINPYRGCEFGCRYCYARYTHEFMEMRDPEAFERKIFVKENAAWLLEQELRRMEKRGTIQEQIALGTATDPWQPIERRAGVTRSLLEVMARHSGLRVGVVTKSTLIERDIDLLQEIDRRSMLVIHVTVTTADVELARKLEPRAPRPDLRLRTVARLRAAGLWVGVLNSPLLPGITDTPQAIDGMARRSKEADATFFAASPLFLKPCSKPTYLGFVREHFPALEPEYARRFAAMDFASRPYSERLRALVSAACKRHGLRERMSDALLTREAEIKKSSRSERPVQQRLFG